MGLEGTVSSWIYGRFYKRFLHYIKSIKKSAIPRYIIREYNGEEVVGVLFEDELVKYEPADMYQIQVSKRRRSKQGLEYLVHYVGWPHTYDEWKLAKEIDG